MERFFWTKKKDKHVAFVAGINERQRSAWNHMKGLPYLTPFLLFLFYNFIVLSIFFFAPHLFSSHGLNWPFHIYQSINSYLSIYLSFSPFSLPLSLSVCSGWERPHRTQKQRGIVFWVKCGKQTLVDGPSGCWQADTLPNAAGTWALVLGKPWVMAAVARGIYESGTWLILGASGVECEFRPHRKVTPSLSFSLSPSLRH